MMDYNMNTYKDLINLKQRSYNEYFIIDNSIGIGFKL